MPNYRLTIQYDGGRYRGWQKLGDNENTIQEKLEKVISEMLGKETELIGCSRTDAGVHALEQIANFKTGKFIADTEVMNYLNRYLPKDICVIEVKKVDENFHARYHAKSKTYLYKIWNKEYSNPFMRKYSMHIEKELDISKMQEAGMHFLGSHDFTAYSNAKSKKKSMVREIYSLKITKEEGFVYIRINGNGFLHNMVRKIVGTLIEVGLGEMSASEIPDIINSGERLRTGRLADAEGLFLEKVEY